MYKELNICLLILVFNTASQINLNADSSFTGSSTKCFEIEFSKPFSSLNQIDTDKDGIADIIDIDDDNDGIPDNIEVCNAYPSNTISIDIELQLDQYPSQTSWSLKNEYGVVVLSGAGYTSTTLITENFTGPFGRYTFRILDSNYNGLSGSPAGSYIIKVDGIVLVGPVTNFTGPSATHIFSAGSANFPCFDGDPSLDNDFDGLLNYQDPDYCILNAQGVCASLDKDADGQVDFLDLDSDNDGIPDIIEAGGVDSNGDGQVDYLIAGNASSMVDLDGDGLADLYDNDNGGNHIDNKDTDKDGIADFLDLDADNDGIPDIVEAGGADDNNDGYVDNFDPAVPSNFSIDDNDGWSSLYDGDPGNDGIPTTLNEGTLLVDTSLEDSSIDSDNDGLPNHLDLDADNDGIQDLVEAGGADDNNDGYVDDYNPNMPSSFDLNDKDGWSSFYDGDAANDGVITTMNDGTNLFSTIDADDNGIPESYTKGNKDLDPYLDYLDLDAYNDGIQDIVEAGGADDNNDGYVDDFDPGNPSVFDRADGDGWSIYFDGDAANDGASTTLEDGDNLIKTLDANSDGFPDGFLSGDFDDDGHLNHLDIDADNDGVVDLVEAKGIDVDGNGLVDNFDILNPLNFDTIDQDGWSNYYDGDVANDGTISMINDGLALIISNDDDHNGFPDFYFLGDFEGDIHPDFLDIDADDDGIVDNVEAQSTAGYLLPDSSDNPDVDGDGLNNSYDNSLAFGGTGIDADLSDIISTPLDFDGDNFPDYIDYDADNDFIPDVQEAWDNLLDGDSRVDLSNYDGSDIDMDGLWDCFDSDTNSSDPTAYVNPIEDNGFLNGTNTPSSPNGGDTPDNIFPDNSGTDEEADWRDVLVDCDLPQVYYGISEQDDFTNTNYQFNPRSGIHIDGVTTGIVRATTYCVPDSDGWHYYHNPLEPNKYLFAIRNSEGSSNTVDFYNLIDYIEIQVELNPANRYVVDSDGATFVMERDWNVVFKNNRGLGNAFDVKFYYQPAEMQNMTNALNTYLESHPTHLRSDLIWFKKTGGLNNNDISASQVVDALDISDHDLNDINENSIGLTDGSETDIGNEKNYIEFTGLTNLSGGTAMISVVSPPLPVELSKFKVVEKDCNVLVNWSADLEENFNFYMVQRSENGYDYNTIAYIEKQAGDGPHRYDYYDDEAKKENLYYRLKMIDLDGSVQYSRIREISTNCNTNEVSVYPNPIGMTDEMLNVSIHTSFSKDIKISITDILGNVVETKMTPLEPGVNNIEWNIYDYPSGTYFVIFNDSKTLLTGHKFIKTNK